MSTTNENINLIADTCNIAGRLASLDAHVIRLVSRLGYYRYHGEWIEWGPITVREINKHQAAIKAARGTRAAIAAERARRKYAPPARVLAEHERVVRGPAEEALRELLAGVTADPVEVEAHLARIAAMAAALLGDSPNPALAILCERAAVSHFVYYHAMRVYYANFNAEELDASDPAMLALDARARVLGRLLERAVKGVAQVKRQDAGVIRRTLDAFKLAS